MPSEKKILSLDLGMQSLRLAEFAVSESGQLKLLRGAKKEFLLDPALDSSRPDQIRTALSEILLAWKLKSGKVACVVPAHSVFTRVVPMEVPGGLSGQMDAVARFEAQQNIPFPLEEVIWDYAVMGELPSGAVNIVFLAVKKDLLESLCSAVEGTGLQIAFITVAPIALHDALKYSGSVQDNTGTTLLIDIGSRTTNLVTSGTGPFFCRSIPSGGLAVTSAIAKDIHATLDESELLKITRGSVGLGPGYEPPADPVEANLARITRQSLIKTQADIARSIGYYRTNLGGSDPTVILLSGGMAAMPYLAEFIQEKFQKPVGFWNIELEQTKSGVNETSEEFIKKNSNNMGELVGGALQFVPGIPHTPVNLLPPFIVKRQSFAKKIPVLACASAFFILSLLALGFFALSAAKTTRAATTEITQDAQRLELISKRINTLRSEQEEIRKTSSDLLSLVVFRAAYPRIIAELASKVPDRYLWITEIQPAVDPTQKGSPSKPTDTTIKALIVKGLYLDNPRQASVIDDFVVNLQSSELFDVKEKEKSKIILQRNSPSGEYWAYPFALRIPLLKPVPTTLP
jgi:type IV pilus assembly protein PilM